MRRVDHRLRQSSRTRRKGMGEMPANPIQLLGAGLVVTVGLAATSGAASAPATGSRLRRGRCARQVEDRLHQPRSATSPGLYVVSADGSGQRRLTGSVLVRTPEWSPDGRRIAFEGVHACRSAGNPARCDRSTGVYVVNADGSFRAEAGAPRERSCLVARRADDRVLQRLQDLPHERRRERAPAP